MKTDFRTTHPLVFLVVTLLINCNPLFAQWQQTNGPYGGYVTALAANGPDIFRSAFDGRISFSSNNGTTWTPGGLELANEYVNVLAISGSDLFAGTSGGGIFYSSNNGTSWASANSGLTNLFVNAFAVSGADLFAGTYSGVYRSTNNGTSWTQVNSGLTSLGVYTFGVDGTNLFSGTLGGGVFRSTNSGTSWTQVISGLTSLDVYALVVSGANLFAGTSGGGVFRSTNSGTSWTQVNSGLTSLYIYSLAVSTNGAGDTSLFAGTYDSGVFRSTNSGATWVDVNSGLTSLEVIALTVGGGSVFVGDATGVFRSTDNGTNWSRSDAGVATASVSSFVVNGQSLFAGMYNSGVFLSTNNGTSWVDVNSGLTNVFVEALAVSGTSVFVGTYGGGVYTSTNNGTIWAGASSGLTDSNVIALAVRPDTIGGANLFAGTVNGVFRSTNSGVNWAPAGLTGTYVYALAFIGQNLFAGTAGAGVFVSTNSGTSWTAVNSGLVSAYVYALGVLGTNLFATTDNGVFLSTNNGTSWAPANSGLSSSYARALTVSPDGDLFVATDGPGVHLSTNGGTSWTLANSGLPYPTDIRALAVVPGDSGGGYLFAGPSSQSAWRLPLAKQIMSVEFSGNPTSLDFGVITPGNTVKDTIYIKNTGTGGPLIVASISSTDLNFSTQQSSGSISTGDSMLVEVLFSPTSSGLKTGSLVIDNNAATSPDTIALLGIGLGPGVQDVTNYTFSASSGTFTPLSNAISPPISGGFNDDGFYNYIPLGFTFTYCGVTYSLLHANANGWVALGAPIPNTTGQDINNLTNGLSSLRPLIAPLWDNMSLPSAASVSFKTEGVPGTRTFTLQWLNMKWQFSAPSAGISVQMKLYELDGRIEFVYRQEIGGLSSPGASIGITGGSGNFLSLQGTNASPSVSSSSENSLLNAKPATGQVYMFSPPQGSQGVTLTQNTLQIGQGTSNQDIIRIEITKLGTGPSTVTKFSLGTQGSTNPGLDISRARLFSTGTSSVFDTSDQFGQPVNSPNGLFEMNGSQPLSSGTNYFWVAYDLTPSAVIGNVADAVCGAVVINSTYAIPVAYAPAGSRSIQNVLTGTKTIDTSGVGDYLSLTSAINDLNVRGVGSGGVTFNVAAGQTFRESPPNIRQTGTISSPIIFQKNGVGANPLVIPTIPGTRTMTALNGDAIIRIIGCDYLVFDGIDLQENPIFTNSTQKMEAGYMLVKTSSTDACKNVTIKNCNITLDKTVTGSAGVYVSILDSAGGTPPVYFQAGRTESVNIHSNSISNVYFGINLYGYPVSAPYDLYDIGAEIGVDGGNTITNFSSTGIYSKSQNDIKVANNTIVDLVGGTVTRGILLAPDNNGTGSINANVDIYGNTITLVSTTSAISNEFGQNGTTNTVNIHDNIIEGCGSTSTSSLYIVRNYANANNVNIYGNIFRDNSFTGSGSTVYLMMATTASSLSVHHNVLRRNQGAGTLIGIQTNGSSIGTNQMYDNVVDSLVSNAVSAGIGAFTGRTVSVYGNSLSRIISQSATSYASGLSAGGNAYDSIFVYNNSVAGIYAPNSTSTLGVKGLDLSISGFSKGFVYHNTVYLDAQSSSASTFGSAGISTKVAPIELRNNIVVNRSIPGPTGGATVAFYRQLPGFVPKYLSSSNDNDLYVDSGLRRYFYLHGTDADSTLAAFKARVSPADTRSFAEIPPFVNVATAPYDVHIQPTVPTQVESGGFAITTPVNVSVDIDSNSRNASYPDIGADEFAGVALDSTGPVLTYTPLLYSLPVNRTLTATVIDAGGVAGGTNMPRLYYKKNSDPVFVVDSLPVISKNSYLFTLDISRIGGGVGTDDTIKYYIAAQDESGNCSTNPFGGSGNNPPGSTPPPQLESYIITQVVSAFPYLEDFEAGTDKQELSGGSGWATGVVMGGANDWEMGNPAKSQISAAHSGTNAYVTKITGNYSDDQKSFLGSPEFDLSFVGDPVVLSFWHNFKTETGYDGCTIEFTTDAGATWRRVDSTLGSGSNFNTARSSNWYNSSSVLNPNLPPPYFSNSSTAYSGHSSGWIKSVDTVWGVAGRSNVRFRWLLQTDENTNNDGWAIDDVGLQVGPPPAMFSVSTTNLDFGEIRVGEETTDSIQVRSVGTGNLIVSSAVSTDSSFEISPTSFVVPAGDSVAIAVIFTPASSGSKTGHILFSHNGGPAPDTVNLSGVGVQATFSVNPSTIAFDSVSAGITKIDSVTVTNAGEAQLIIDSVRTFGGEFSVLPNGTDSLAASGGMKKYYITFSPTTVGSQSGGIIWYSNSQQLLATKDAKPIANSSDDVLVTSGVKRTLAAAKQNSVSVSKVGVTDGAMYSDALDTMFVNGVGIPFLIHFAVSSGWNMISNPVTATNDSVSTLFPNATHPYAFRFSGSTGYQQDYTMDNGVGYWEKFASSSTQSITGLPRTIDSIDVVSGWNMVGSISDAVDTANIVSSSPGLRRSDWFGYDTTGYSVSQQILPGKAYWIKAAGVGKFFLGSAAVRAAVKEVEPAPALHASDLSRLTIRDAQGRSQTLYFGKERIDEEAALPREMPPIPPSGAFDARFSAEDGSTPGGESAEGGLMVRTYSTETENTVELPIVIQSDAYPLTVSWNINSGGLSYTLSDAVGGVVFPDKEMRNEGAMSIANSALKRIAIKVTVSSSMPKDFALSQNYPNPFNPVTTIKYALPVASRVTIEIFNTLGQRVQTLVNEDRPAGYQTIEWNGTGSAGQQLGSGVYFVRLGAVGLNGTAFIDVRKVVMLK